MIYLLKSAISSISNEKGQINEGLRSHGRRVSMNMIAFANRDDLIKKK